MSAADVGNPYLHGFNKKNIYTVAGTYFCEWEGKVLLCVISVYGLNTSMARWNEALLDKLKLIGF